MKNPAKIKKKTEKLKKIRKILETSKTVKKLKKPEFFFLSMFDSLAVYYFFHENFLPWGIGLPFQR